MLILRVKKMIIGLVIFLVAFVVRFVVWIYPGIGWDRLTIYDVQLYTDYGKEMIAALSKWDFAKFASINVGVPPLGTLLVGLCEAIFDSLLESCKAGLLAPIIASSLTAILIYLILYKFSSKVALISSFLFGLDPYLIQFSGAYLDSIGTFFIMAAMLLFTNFKKTSKNILIVGFFFMLSILTKFTFAVFTMFFITLLILLKKDYWSAGMILVLSLSSIFLLPWIWFPSARQEAIVHHTSMNSLLPPIIFGPMIIGVPESYPWYFLTYFGLGQVFWNTLPSISHILLLPSLLVSFMRKELNLDDALLLFVAASILSIVFIPRNYWTYEWGMGFAKGEGVLFKQFYPYYFYFPNVIAGMISCKLLIDRKGFRELSCRELALVIPLIVYALTSPLAFVMNLYYPYWDFIFTLILNYSKGDSPMAYSGYVAFMVTLILSIFISSTSLLITVKQIRAKCTK